MIAWGLVQWLRGEVGPAAPATGSRRGHEALTLFLALRAFASGCAALTGIEAVSDGVPAFRAPEAQNARQVLAVLGLILIVLFVGITFLVYVFHIMPVAGETTNSQLARHVFGAVALLLPGPGRHPAHPDPRGQHELRRLPAGRLVPRARRFRAASVREPGRPARVLERDPHPDRPQREPPDRLPGRHARPDPPLRGRRLPVLHPQTGEHGPVLAAAPPAGLGVRRHGPGHRGHRDRARHGRHRGDEVHATGRGSSSC